MNSSLINISAFAFENYLGRLKKMIRSLYRPLAQVCHHLQEKAYMQNNKPTIVPNSVKYFQEDKQILNVQYKNLLLTTKAPNNVVLCNDDSILKITNFYTAEDDKLYMRGNNLKIKKSVYEYPSDDPFS